MTVCRVGTHKRLFKADVSPEIYEELTIPNPVYYEHERLGLSTSGVPRYIELYRERDEFVDIPRNISIDNFFNYIEYINETVEGSNIGLKSKVSLRNGQVPAVEDLVNSNNGILVAPCGAGKTVMAIEAISRVKKTTLILVHKEFLLDQWAGSIKDILGEEVGIISRGKVTGWQNKKINIAMLQTLYSHRDLLPEEFLYWPGIVISDETHRISAPTWSEVIQLFPAKRRWGLTATPNRPDGLGFIFKAHIGNIIHRMEAESLTPSVYMIGTGLYVPHRAYINQRNNKFDRAKFISYLVLNENRNRLILQHLINAAKAGRQILVLTERVNHAKFLEESFLHNMQDKGVSTSLFLGETSREERVEAVTKDVIFATSQMAKEALDIPTLDTLFLATPVASPITVQQSTGRILRELEGKRKPLVLDFVDGNSVALGMSRKRWAIYDHLGYEIYGIN